MIVFPRRRIIYAAAVFFALAVVPGAAPVALAAERPAIRTIEVSGEGRVDVPADLALVDFGVVTQAETAEAASRENSARMERVVAALRRQLSASDARISTGTYSIRPVYATASQGAAPRVTGYSVSNVVHVRMNTLARVGEVIDAAVKAGANQVQRLMFTLTDDTQPRRTALERATLQARDKATTIAGALGLKAGVVHSVTEYDQGVVRPLAREAFAVQADSAVTTPIEPGLIEVRARVVLRMEIESVRSP